MIKEIEKPKIKFEIFIKNNDKFYYDEENNEYFFEDCYENIWFFNLEGNVHRIDKPAIIYNHGVEIYVENNKWHRYNGPAYINEYIIQFWINDHYYSTIYFAEETNHLICKFCEKFCKQGCFL